MFTLCNPNMTGLLQGEHPEIWAQSDPPPADLSVEDIRSQIAAELLQIAQRSQWRAYRKLPSLFLMVPSLTPYDLSFPRTKHEVDRITRCRDMAIRVCWGHMEPPFWGKERS